MKCALASSKRAYNLARNLENPVLVRNIDLARAQALLETGQLREAGAIVAGMRPPTDTTDDELPRLRAQLALARGDAGTALAALNVGLDRGAEPAPTLLPIFVTAALRGGDSAAARRILERSRHAAANPEEAFAIELARG